MILSPQKASITSAFSTHPPTAHPRRASVAGEAERRVKSVSCADGAWRLLWADGSTQATVAPVNVVCRLASLDCAVTSRCDPTEYGCAEVSGSRSLYGKPVLAFSRDIQVSWVLHSSFAFSHLPFDILSLRQRR